LLCGGWVGVEEKQPEVSPGRKRDLTTLEESLPLLKRSEKPLGHGAVGGLERFLELLALVAKDDLEPAVCLLFEPRHLACLRVPCKPHANAKLPPRMPPGLYGA